MILLGGVCNYVPDKNDKTMELARSLLINTLDIGRNSSFVVDGAGEIQNFFS